MVDGQIGVVGLHAVNLVELGPKNVPEAVHDQLQDMAGKLVREQPKKNKSATSSPVLFTEVGQAGRS